MVGVGTERMTSLDFAEVARRLGSGARSAGHQAPSFRSPPRVKGCQRSIQRRKNGSATVAVAIKDRPIAGVVADMIDGVVAMNDLVGLPAGALRDRLWMLVSDLLVPTKPLAEVRPIKAA